jgi:predicted RNA methylase
MLFSILSCGSCKRLDMPSFIDFIPPPFGDVDVFFELSTITPDEFVYDLGSGDGRLLFAALKKGTARAVGIEIDAKEVHEGTEIARNKGVEDKVTFVEADVLDIQIGDATNVLCYIHPVASSALRS